jgi:hypothetical protein
MDCFSFDMEGMRDVVATWSGVDAGRVPLMTATSAFSRRLSTSLNAGVK